MYNHVLPTSTLGTDSPLHFLHQQAPTPSTHPAQTTTFSHYTSFYQPTHHSTAPTNQKKKILPDKLFTLGNSNMQKLRKYFRKTLKSQHQPFSHNSRHYWITQHTKLLNNEQTQPAN